MIPYEKKRRLPFFLVCFVVPADALQLRSDIISISLACEQREKKKIKKSTIVLLTVFNTIYMPMSYVELPLGFD